MSASVGVRVGPVGVAKHFGMHPRDGDGFIVSMIKLVGLTLFGLGWLLWQLVKLLSFPLRAVLRRRRNRRMWRAPRPAARVA